VGTGTALYLRTRMVRSVVLLLLVVAGATIGAGALLLQSEVSIWDWVVTLVALSFAAPLESRVVLGPFGRTEGPSSGTVRPSSGRE